MKLALPKTGDTWKDIVSQYRVSRVGIFGLSFLREGSDTNNISALSAWYKGLFGYKDQRISK